RRQTRATPRASRPRATRSHSCRPSRAGTRRSETRGSRSSRGTRRPNAGPPPWHESSATRAVRHALHLWGMVPRVSQAQILVLGAVAGFTIFIGLPVGRMQSLSQSTRAFLSAVATGILIFLLWDVLAAAVEPVEGALTAGNDGR